VTEEEAERERAEAASRAEMRADARNAGTTVGRRCATQLIKLEWSPHPYRPPASSEIHVPGSESPARPSRPYLARLVVGTIKKNVIYLILIKNEIMSL
jgi:hypothetical protein